MSQENVEIIRRGYEAFAKGRIAFELLDPEIEWRGPREFPDLAEPRRGHEGVATSTSPTRATTGSRSSPPRAPSSAPGDGCPAPGAVRLPTDPAWPPPPRGTSTSPTPPTTGLRSSARRVPF